MAPNKTTGISIFLLFAILVMSMSLYARDDVDAHRYCSHCGMDRKAYGFSRMLLHFEDGTVIGVCSIHCATAELHADTLRKVKRMEVADRATRALIDAEKAFWVIGGDKPGVMAATATWAFGEEKRAGNFVKKHGGRTASFKEAFDAVSKPE